jgi:hypothetical protein
MSTSGWKQWMSVAGTMLLAFAFIFSQSALAGQNQSKDKAESPQKATAQRTGEKQFPPVPSAKGQAEEAQRETTENTAANEQHSRDASHQAIKIHGHWTIEVRNPDGSVVTHREFENALFPSPALASILARQVAAGFWTIALYPGTVCGNTNGAGCSIGEPGQTLYAWNSSNLSVTVSGNSLVLSGTVLASGGGTVTTVQTDMQACPATVAPSSPCQGWPSGTTPPNFGFGATGGFIFTSTDPSPGIPVSAGQTVAVTVNISFS